MQWEKFGQIFNFQDSPFKERFVSHAQSPQAVVFDDFVRVYFTTRIKDTDKTFISIPQFVDYSKDFSRIINFSKEEIISTGKLGCFDEHGIFPFSPFKTDGKIWAYTNGWTRRVSVDVDSGIGFAQSDDNGISFRRMGDGPVLTASLYEPFLVGDPFVRKFNGLYYMFYIYGQKWSDTKIPERVYKIAYATSTNGFDWVKANRNIISDVIDENECQALPTVIETGGRYHIYFCFRHMAGFRTEPGKGYRIGYAYSDDLVNWVRDDKAGGITLSESGWDSEMMCYPNIFDIGKDVFLLYNGNAFGKDGFGLARLSE
jgi:hypothetical protein